MRVTNAPKRNARYKRFKKIFSGHTNQKNKHIVSGRKRLKRRIYTSAKLRKRENRRLWNKLISAWSRTFQSNYSSVIGRLLKSFDSRKEIYFTIRDHYTNGNNLDKRLQSIMG